MLQGKKNKGKIWERTHILDIYLYCDTDIMCWEVDLFLPGIKEMHGARIHDKEHFSNQRENFPKFIHPQPGLLNEEYEQMKQPWIAMVSALHLPQSTKPTAVI